MSEFCFTINGVRHCFPLPMLVDPGHIRRPPPNNMPPLELAVTVLELVKVAGDSELARELTSAANRYVEVLQRQLPKGVEITLGGHTAS